MGANRAIGSSWAYHSLYRSYFTLNLDDLTPPSPCTEPAIIQIRMSKEWLDSAATGMAPATHYDNNNGAGVAIDGSPDSVPVTPVTTWKQVSGGQVDNYYPDDQAVSPTDTGDGRSFGDAGFVVTGPAGQVSAETLTFFLDPDQPNLGFTYQSYYANPLEIVVTAQSCGPPYYVYIPLLTKDTP
jgi:hypothetical protein